MISIDGNALPAFASAAPLTRARGAVSNKRKSIKQACLAFAALCITGVSFASMPIGQLNYDELSKVVQKSSHDTYDLSGFVGAAVQLDLRPISGQSYFASAADPHGIAFVCQTSFKGFTGGPVNATIVRIEFGDGSRDFMELDACTPLER